VVQQVAPTDRAMLVVGWSLPGPGIADLAATDHLKRRDCRNAKAGGGEEGGARRKQMPERTHPSRCRGIAERVIAMVASDPRVQRAVANEPDRNGGERGSDRAA